MSLNFRAYGIEDFVLDRSFKNWVLNPDRDSNLFWEQWIRENPDKIQDLQKAREILLRMSRIDFKPEPGAVDEVWERIFNNLNHEARNQKVIPLGPASLLNESSYPGSDGRIVVCKVAASIIFLLATLLSVILLEENDELSVAETIIKSNPRGQKSIVHLPDGTKVHLNSESQLSYEEGYNTNDRVVNLNGEAFFDVHKDPSRPFTVVTDLLNTTALGTSFNVEAYPNKNNRISLMTGKVVVKSNSGLKKANLLPGEQVVGHMEGHMVKEHFDIKKKALWRDHIIYFDDTPIEEALFTLERWYDVKFEVKGMDPNLICSGKFEDDYLSNVLASMGYTLHFSYSIDGKKVTLRFK